MLEYDLQHNPNSPINQKEDQEPNSLYCYAFDNDGIIYEDFNHEFYNETTLDSLIDHIEAGEEDIIFVLENTNTNIEIIHAIKRNNIFDVSEVVLYSLNF